MDIDESQEFILLAIKLMEVASSQQACETDEAE